MAETKYPLIRYLTLDKCFRNKHKRFFIDDLIDACSSAVADYCGEEICCSRRTIFNDIEFMESDAGWSIPLDRLKDGHRVYYRYSNPDFSINSTVLSETDFTKLNEAVTLLERFKGMPSFEWMDDLLIKLQSGFIKSSDTIIDFEQAPFLKGMEFFDTIFNAILYKQTLKVTYNTYNSQKYTWTIHPYLLKQYNNRWFLFGKNASRNGKISNLSLDRIEKITDDSAPYQEGNGQLQQMLENVVGVTFNENSHVENVKLKFSPTRFPYVTTKLIHKSQTIFDEQERIVQLLVMPNKELIAQILQFGSDVEVLQPSSLRQEVKEIAEKMMENYRQCGQEK